MVKNLLLVLSGAIIASGLRPDVYQGRIVGGVPAAEGQFPYQVSLRHFGQGEHICGGSIISNQWILTAAHCVEGATPQTILKAVVGSLLVSGGGTSYAVIEIHQHQDFNATIFKSDVALLRVKPIVYTDVVKPIALESEFVGDQEASVVSGWGMHSFPGPISDDLYYVNLTTTTVEFCAEVMVQLNKPVDETQVCTLTKAGEGFCRFDSGGPLVRTVNGVRRQIGIVSFAALCALGVPDVYTRVSSHRSWINETCGGCI